MKKLRLDDVRVESFTLGAKRDARGTVVGNAVTAYCTEVCEETSDRTCAQTCNPNDCMSSVYFMGQCTMP